MRKPTLVIAVLFACASLPALAQQELPAPPAVQAAPPKAEDAPAAVKAPPAADKAPQASRFSFNRVDDGFLRLDNQTGQIAYCSPHTVGWSCQAVPEDRAAMEKEISRLKDEIAGLKAQVALLREPPPPPRPPADLTPVPPPAPPSPMADKGQDQANRDSAKLRDDLERARLAFENAWRRLVEMIANLQKDMKRKS